MADGSSQAPRSPIPEVWIQPRVFWNGSDALAVTNHARTTVSLIKPSANILAISKKKHDDVTSSSERLFLRPVRADYGDSVSVEIFLVKVLEF